MFSYYHTYMPEIWQGMLKNGFIDKNCGIRLNLNIEFDKNKERAFNNIAKEGGRLWNIIKDGNLGFYVDRLSGGIYYFDYRPDVNLIEKYKNLCGDRFLGLQLHEWASNYLGEFKKLFSAGLEVWTKDEIIAAYKRLFPDLKHLMVESMSIDELYALYPPSNIHHLYKNLDYLFKSRCEKTSDSIITCDSYALGFDYEFKNGARNIMSEIGGQTEDVRLQMAYARGSAKAHKKRFGTYYEPWGGKPLSAVGYNESRSEWQPECQLEFAYSQGTANSGSTRSLQRRLHFYSYFSGAEFMSEEWCANTTFYDWNDFELTPYGKVKKEFLDFVSKYDIGKPITPIAAVLPKDFRFIHSIHETGDYYMNMPIYSGFAQTVKVIRNGLCSLFSDSFDMTGNEYKQKPDGKKFIMINSPVPDAIDIIHEDSANIDDYDYLVDLTSNGGFCKKHSNTVDICKAKQLICNLLPCTVKGNVAWSVTQNKDRFFLCIFNNDGVYYDIQNGEYTDKNCTHRAEIDLKNRKSAKVIYSKDAKLSLSTGKYYIDILPGDFAVIEF